MDYVEKGRWVWKALVFAGVVAVVVLLMRGPSTPNALSSDMLDDGDIFYQRAVENFSCDGAAACDDVIILVNGERVSGSDCTECREMSFWANYTDDTKQTVMISGYDFRTVYFDVADAPRWEEEPSVIMTDDGTRLSLTLRDGGDWNMLQDAECLTNCTNLRVGNIYTNTIYLDTCPPDPCDVIEIDHNGMRGDEHSPGGYGIRAYQRVSDFAQANSPITLMDIAYTEEELAAASALHVEEDWLGHRIAFDLVAE